MSNFSANDFEVVIIGAGGAGMMCAIESGKRGRRVALLDHSATIGRKILISGGGRCNFTNIGAGPAQYVAENPHFCTSALSRYQPSDFIELVRAHQIPFHEKKLGQLFCDGSAQAIVDMLVAECKKAQVQFLLEHAVQSVQKEARFRIATNRGTITGDSLVIATGGLSLPKLGASDLGYRIAQQFGLKIVPPAPALDGLRFDEKTLENFQALAGVSAEALVTCDSVSFRENILFTHSGLSGPAALQASLYWRPGKAVQINFLPDFAPSALLEWFREKKLKGVRAGVKNLLAELLPKRLAERLCELAFPATQPASTPTPLPQLSEKALESFCRKIQRWEFIPQGTVGYQRAEVTRGGVDTRELSSKTMESKKIPGLYFIGEVVDVTGWLGGYNFQWAWASGWAAGQVA